MKFPFSTLIFDFDLTLADSREAAFDCINFALAELGHAPVSFEETARTIGLSLPETYLSLVGREFAPWSNDFPRYFKIRANEVMTTKTRLFADTVATVQTLKARGYALGIVSTKFRYRIAEILERDNLLSPFNVIIGGEDVTHHKPHPESLLLAMEKLNVTPATTLYLGDSLTDAQTAHRAAVPFAAVLSGVTRREEFDDYAPAMILNTIGDLLNYTGKR